MSAPRPAWWQRLRHWLSGAPLPAALRPARELPEALWRGVLGQYPFLQALDATEQAALRALCARFLADKEFHGAHGLVVTDAMALAVAAQACLPLLHLGQGLAALDWYGDFVGIVMHPGPALARRESVDEDGVVHEWDEELAGEAMERGPVMLSWPDVAEAGASAEAGYNVVIHEFIHKMDLRDGEPDGCPPLPAGFMGHGSYRAAREAWHQILQAQWHQFQDRVTEAERFGQPAPWLDPYGAEALDEFWAVACEAYFVNRARFAAEFAALLPLFDAFFRPATVTPAAAAG